MYFMSTTCGRPKGGGGPAHVDRGGGSKSDFFVDVINGWPLSYEYPYEFQEIMMTMMS